MNHKYMSINETMDGGGTTANFDSSMLDSYIDNIKSIYPGCIAEMSSIDRGKHLWHDLYIKIKDNDRKMVRTLYIINRGSKLEDVYSLNKNEIDELNRIIKLINMKSGGGRKIRKSQGKKTYKKRNKSKRKRKRKTKQK